MNNKDFANALIDIAKNHKTLYVMGCFGAPMNTKNKARYSSNNAYNKQEQRAAMIKGATADTFGFDCVCLIKGVLWGWNGDKTKTYGGAIYASNGVPDIGANTMFSKCSEASTNFSNIEIGEAVWMDGHIGVYIGDGLAVECTPSWSNNVQITACNRNISGYNRRDWTKHGKLPYITYESQATPYIVEVAYDDLRIRAGAGTNYDAVGFVKKGRHTIIEESDGKGASKWGRLESGEGWIALDWATPIVEEKAEAEEKPQKTPTDTQSILDRLALARSIIEGVEQEIKGGEAQ